MDTKTKLWGLAAALAVVALMIVGPQSCARGPAGVSVSEIASERDLSEADITAALKTYVPTGQMDEYVMFSSGGHSGQVLVIGLPSMRLLKVIAAFTPEPWQGYGYGAGGTMTAIEGGRVNGKEVLWGDTHHPAISETDGDYDGEFLFIDDKANARVAVISLKDFETKQLLHNPLMGSDHGATFVTPNTEYVIQSSQYAVPLDGSYADISEYQERYRGAVTFWKFDREAGRIDPTRSFTLELPPYWQDLADAGKGPSFGWVFLGSFNSEMATGGLDASGGVPFEAGASSNDMDYLHTINWQRAEEVFQSGNGVQRIQGMSVIPLDVSIGEGLLYLVPEPKSPHGADVTPDGRFIVTAGKLDPHVSVYSFEKVEDAIANETYSGSDPFGVPILDFDAVLEAQVELGLGPLHTQFDGRGNAYTSLFIESAVAKWSLETWTLDSKIDVHYNIGHLAAAEGDTKSPDGNFLVALDKWSIDRFLPVGPLHPQNFQLIDIENAQMQLLYDMPIGIGEPHYAQIIKADKLDPWLVYPANFNPHEMATDPNAVASGQERVERSGNTVNVYMTAIRSHFTPEHISVRQGDRVRIHLTSVESARDATHGFAIDKYNINVSLEPGESEVIEFVADKAGVYPFYCSEFCSALHLEMAGYLFVEP